MKNGKHIKVFLRKGNSQYHVLPIKFGDTDIIKWCCKKYGQYNFVRYLILN